MESEAGQVGNLWLCVSAFNSRAIAFYERQGFQPVADLPDLVTPGFAELLMRKRLAR
jgi:ribosomal protein S18 acetylase RimI-like enzyme